MTTTFLERRSPQTGIEWTLGHRRRKLMREPVDVFDGKKISHAN